MLPCRSIVASLILLLFPGVSAAQTAARAMPAVIADPIDPSLELEPVTDSDFPNDPSLLLGDLSRADPPHRGAGHLSSLHVLRVDIVGAGPAGSVVAGVAVGGWDLTTVGTKGTSWFGSAPEGQAVRQVGADYGGTGDPVKRQDDAFPRRDLSPMKTSARS